MATFQNIGRRLDFTGGSGTFPAIELGSQRSVNGTDSGSIGLVRAAPAGSSGSLFLTYPTGVEDFIDGEEIHSYASEWTALADLPHADFIELFDVGGAPSVGQIVVGVDSGARATVSSVDTITDFFPYGVGTAAHIVYYSAIEGDFDPEEVVTFEDAEAEGPTATELRVQAYARTLLDLLPPGSAWTRESDSNVQKLLLGIAVELERIDQRGLDLIEESDPRTADETIEQWEDMVGLPDERVPEIPATLALRRFAVTQKLVARGGQNEAFFIALAAACGYTLQPAGTLATPVITGVAQLAGGGSLTAGTKSYRVSALNDRGETLASAASTVVVNLNDRAQPSWSKVVGATGYRIFGRTGGSELLIAEVGEVLTYIDTGAITPAGPLPVTGTATTEPITRFVDRILRVGFRVGDRVYGDAYAYSFQLNILEPAGEALDPADFERIIEHVTHAHVTAIFNYL